MPESRDFPKPFTDELIAAGIPDPIPVGRLPVVPIAASVGLHALLSLLFLNLAPRTGELHGPTERTAITVNLRQFEKPEVEIPQEVAELPAPSEPVGIVQSETEEPEEPLPDSLEDKTDMENPVEPEVAVLNSGIATGSAGYADDEVGQPFLDTGQINAAVNSYVSGYRQGLTGNWLTDCVRYEIEHGVQNCPQGQEQRSVQQQRI